MKYDLVMIFKCLNPPTHKQSLNICKNPIFILPYCMNILSKANYTFTNTTIVKLVSYKHLKIHFSSPRHHHYCIVLQSYKYLKFQNLQQNIA